MADLVDVEGGVGCELREVPRRPGMVQVDASKDLLHFLGGDAPVFEAPHEVVYTARRAGLDYRSRAPPPSAERRL